MNIRYRMDKTYILTQLGQINGLLLRTRSLYKCCTHWYHIFNAEKHSSYGQLRFGLDPSLYTTSTPVYRIHHMWWRADLTSCKRIGMISNPWYLWHLKCNVTFHVINWLILWKQAEKAARFRGCSKYWKYVISNSYSYSLDWMIWWDWNVVK